MFTVEQLESINTLTLFMLLFDSIDDAVNLWRKIHLNEFPTEEQEKEISEKETYSMTIAKVLISRGALPENWCGQ